MQITPSQNNPLPNALPQDAATKAIPQVSAQVGPPLIQRAIDPTSKSEKGNSTRSNGDKAKAGKTIDREADRDRGHKLDIQI